MPADGSTAVSGVDGFAVVSDMLLLRLKQWTVNPVAGESVWGDSDSVGFTVRKRAREDCTGSMTGVLDSGSEVYDIFKSGDNVKLVLWQSSSAGDYWVFPRALIQNFSLTSNQDTKEVMEWSANFGADGQFWFPGQSGAPSESIP